MTTRKAAADRVRVEGLQPHEIHTSAQRLRDELSRECERFALRALGAPVRGSPEWLEWRGALGTPLRREQDRRVALTAIAIFVTAGFDPTAAVFDARETGASWSMIAAATGTSKQAAQIRWAERATTVLLERDAGADRRASPRPLVSPLDEFDATGKGVVGEATRSRRGRRAAQPRPDNPH